MKSTKYSIEDYLIKLGIETCLHYLYRNKDQKRYESYSTGFDYKTKNDIVTKLIHMEADKASRSSSGECDNSRYMWYVLNGILSQIVREVSLGHIIDSFSSTAKIMNVSWGDNTFFDTEENCKYITLDHQSKIKELNIYENKVILTPFVNKLPLSFNEKDFDILNGFDLGSFVYMVAESLKVQIETKIFKLKEHSRLPKEESYKIVFEGDIIFIEKDQKIEITDRYTIGATVLAS